MAKSILFISASPRKEGTSSRFAKTLSLLCNEKNHNSKIIYIIEYLDNKRPISELENIIDQADIISIISPLYIDSAPYPLIWFLEYISENYTNLLRDKSIFAIAQSGFPNQMVLEAIIESCRLFSVQNHMNWLGGVKYGGGVIIDGKDLSKMGKMGASILKNFDLLLDDVLSDREISSNIIVNLTNNIPKILYRPLATFLNHNTKKEAKKNGVTDLCIKIYD